MPTDEAAPRLSPCGEIARAHDPDRFLCALLAPADRRETLFVLAALNHELARAREVASNPLIALMRLTWWREVAEDAAAGKPPRRHEVATPLHAEIGAGRVLAEDVIAMCDAREVEAEEDGAPGLEAFHAWLRGTSGRLAIMAGRALGAPPARLPGLEAAGALHGLAATFRGLHRRAHPILPAEAVAEAGGVAPLIRRLAAEAPTAAAAAALRGLPRACLAAALPLVLARRDLARLAAGRPADGPRGIGDRAAVMLAALRGRV